MNYKLTAIATDKQVSYPLILVVGIFPERVGKEVDLSYCLGMLRGT
jgi:hypothetical protein